MIYSRYIFYLYFNSLCLELLVSQSKLSGIRKDTLKYKLSEMNLDLYIYIYIYGELTVEDKIFFSVYSVDNLLTNTRRSFYRRTALHS